MFMKLYQHLINRFGKYLLLIFPLIKLQERIRCSIPQPTLDEIQSIEQGGRVTTQLGRMTASNFFFVCTKVNTLAKNPTANVESLCNVLLGNVKAPELG